MCKTSQGALGLSPSTFVSYGLAVDVRSRNLPLPAQDVILENATNNLPLTGCYILRIAGANFQNVDASPTTQVSFTSFESTSWISQSSLIALASSGVGNSEFLLLSVAGRRSNVISLSFIRLFTNLSVLSSGKTFATSGAAKLLFFGNGMGVFGISPAARVMQTACNIFSWTSESAIVCKVAAGSGASDVLVISHNCVTHICLQQYSKLRIAYAVPGLKTFSGSSGEPANVLLHGSNFAPFNSEVSSSAGFVGLDGAVPMSIGSQKVQVLVTTDAFLQGKSVKDIEVRVQFSSSRLDDVVLTLETSPFVGRIFLLKNQCFGCVTKGNDTFVNFVFSDNALRYLPVTDCSSGTYLPSNPFSTLFAYSGLVFLQATSGSTPVAVASASITIMQSNVNVVAGQTYPSLSINWFSDSSLEFRIPAILGKNHTLEAIVDGQRSNLMAGLNYPRPLIQQQSANETIPASGSSTVMAYGSFFGQRPSSLSARIGKSACLSSIWASDNNVFCKISQGISISDVFGATVTVTRQIPTAKTIIAENKSPTLFSAVALNSFSTGNSIIVVVSGLGISRFSPKTRISKSSSPTTIWYSDSSLHGFTAKWKLNIHTTVSIVMRSAEKIFPYNLIQTAHALQEDNLVPKSGSYELAISGAGFETRSSSSRVRMGESGASATLWTSDSAITFKCARIGLESRFAATVTVPAWALPITSDNILIRVPSTELYGAFTFQNRSVVSSTPSWQAYSVLHVQGQDFGFSEVKKFQALTIDPNVGCDSVQWYSDSSLSAACQINPPGSEVTFRLSILQRFREDQVKNSNFVKFLYVTHVCRRLLPDFCPV
jgi:hypothetical protein